MSVSSQTLLSANAAVQVGALQLVRLFVLRATPAAPAVVVSPLADRLREALVTMNDDVAWSTMEVLQALLQVLHSHDLYLKFFPKALGPLMSCIKTASASGSFQLVLQGCHLLVAWLGRLEPKHWQTLQQQIPPSNDELAALVDSVFQLRDTGKINAVHWLAVMSEACRMLAELVRLRSDLQSTDESALRKFAQVVSQLTCWHNEPSADAPNFDLNFFQAWLKLLQGFAQVCSGRAEMVKLLVQVSETEGVRRMMQLRETANRGSPAVLECWTAFLPMLRAVLQLERSHSEDMAVTLLRANLPDTVVSMATENPKKLLDESARLMSALVTLALSKADPCITLEKMPAAFHAWLSLGPKARLTVEWKQPAGRALLAMLYAASICRHEAMPAAVIHELLARPLDVRSVHAETDSAWLLRALSAVCAHAVKQVTLPSVSASSSSSFSAMDGRCSIHIETLLRHASFESPSQILNLRLPFVREWFFQHTTMWQLMGTNVLHECVVADLRESSTLNPTCWLQIFQSEGGRQTVLKWLAVADAAAGAEMLQAMVGAHVAILPLSLEACGVLCARDDQDLFFPILSALMEAHVDSADTWPLWRQHASLLSQAAQRLLARLQCRHVEKQFPLLEVQIQLAARFLRALVQLNSKAELQLDPESLMGVLNHGLRQVADAHVAGLVTQQGLLELLHACLCSSGQEAPVQSLLWPLPIHLASVCDLLSQSVPSSDSAAMVQALLAVFRQPIRADDTLPFFHQLFLRAPTWRLVLKWVGPWCWERLSLGLQTLVLAHHEAQESGLADQAFQCLQLVLHGLSRVDAALGVYLATRPWNEHFAHALATTSITFQLPYDYCGNWTSLLTSISAS